nr:hypothetical protein CJLB15_00001 [Campylobacter phage CJLB-15]
MKIAMMYKSSVIIIIMDILQLISSQPAQMFAICQTN